MNVELISKTLAVGSYKELNQEELVSAIARHSEIKVDNGRLIKYLIKNKHWSPLQFVSFGFKIETSRAISAQIFRHRSLNAQEFSQRYSISDQLETIDFRLEHKKNRQSSTDSIGWILQSFGNILGEFSEDITEEQEEALLNSIDALDQTFHAYKGLIDSGIAKESARMILPMSSRTLIHISGTLRDLLSFLNVRLDHHAQKEVQEIAMRIGEELEKELPLVFEQLNWKEGLFL